MTKTAQVAPGNYGFDHPQRGPIGLRQVENSNCHRDYRLPAGGLKQGNYPFGHQTMGILPIF